VIFIYDNINFETKFIYQSDAPPIELLKANNPGLYDNCSSIKFDDDLEVLKKPHNYRLVVYNNIPITYAIKPNVDLSLSKNEIVSDGEDSAILNLTVSNTHYLDNILSIPVILNETKVDVDIINNVGQLEITATSEGEIKIALGTNKYNYQPIILEVI